MSGAVAPCAASRRQRVRTSRDKGNEGHTLLLWLPLTCVLKVVVVVGGWEWEWEWLCACVVVWLCGCVVVRLCGCAVVVVVVVVVRTRC